jgi:hypothetical protein
MAELSGAKFSQGMLPAMAAVAMGYGLQKAVGEKNEQHGTANSERANYNNSKYQLNVDMTLGPYNSALDPTNSANWVVDASGSIVPVPKGNLPFKILDFATKHADKIIPLLDKTVKYLSRQGGPPGWSETGKFILKYTVDPVWSAYQNAVDNNRGYQGPRECIQGCHQ